MSSKGRSENTLLILLIASVAGYFLLPTAQSSNVPTYFLAVCAAVLTYQHWRRLALSNSLVFRALVAFLGYFFLSSLWSESVSIQGITSTLTSVLLLLFFAVSIRQADMYFGDVNVLLAKVIAVSAGSSALIYLVMSANLVEHNLNLGRWNTNSVAAMGYGLAGVFATYLVTTAGSVRVRVFWMFLLGVLVLACLKIQDSFVMFAFVSALATLALSRVWDERGSSAAFLWIGVSGIALALCLFLLSSAFESERPILWNSLVDEIFERSPIFGVGVLANVSTDVCDKVASCGFDHAHNVFISTLYYGGVVGLGLVSLLVIWTLSALFESSDHTRSLIIAVLVYGFCILLFDGDRIVSKMTFVWLVFWVPIASAMSLEIADEQAYKI